MRILLVEDDAFRSRQEGQALVRLCRGRNDRLINGGNLVGQRRTARQGREVGLCRGIALHQVVDQVNEDVLAVKDRARACTRLPSPYSLFKLKRASVPRYDSN